MKRKILLLLAAQLFALPAGAATLNYGRYFGAVQMEGQAESVAIALDAFVVQTKDPTVYPALEVIVRANLGGYVSPEYVGYEFYDPAFDFEKGVLQLSAPKSDFTATLSVTNTDTETILEGPVLHRLTNTKGRMRVVMELDGTMPPAPAGALVSAAQGEYVGSCGQTPADLQIETARGLAASAPGNALTGYSITGRIGYPNGPLCTPDKTNKYCSHYVFSTGAYSPFTNRLTLQGALGTADCQKSGATLTCRVFGRDRTERCQLTKKAAAPTPPTEAPAAIFLDVPAEQMQPLPPPSPPGNEPLVAALDGDFFGFLHFENRDVYALMEMNVAASTSTENPHIQNQVNVAPTVLLRVGASWEEHPALSFFYPQRVFGLTDGFAFGSDDEEYFPVVAQWKTGYVSGVLYSRAYGRVGTFELRKGVRPAPPAGMALVANPAGHFRGPADAPSPFRNLWSISVEIPGFAPGPGQSGVPLLARYVGPGQMMVFDAASLDLNTGSLGFLIKEKYGDRIVAGEALPGKGLKLTWPTGPVLGAPMGGYGAFSYPPQPNERGGFADESAR